jgi:predicted nucleic acid-binding protein
MSGKPLFYWDANPLIAWITDEVRPPEEMAGLEEVIKLVELGKATILTSALWRVEVLDSTLSPMQVSVLKKLFEGRHITDVSADSRVLDLAHEIRAYYYVEHKKNLSIPKVSAPDSIHLATAILYGVTEFHTFDGATQKGGVGKLLKLNGNVAGHSLKICKPVVAQLQLNFGQQPHSKSLNENSEE